MDCMENALTALTGYLFLLGNDFLALVAAIESLTALLALFTLERLLKGSQ